MRHLKLTLIIINLESRMFQGFLGVSRQDSGRWWRNKPGQDQLGQFVPSALWEDLSAEMSYRPYNLRFVLRSRM